MRNLRSHIWIVAVAVSLLSGCASKSREAFLHQGEVAMIERFDFASVDAFLRRVVAAHRSVEGVSLASAHIGSPWRMVDQDYPIKMRSGRWLLDDRGRKDEFDLCYELPGKRVIVVRAKRVSRTEFEAISVSLEFIASTTL